MSGPWRVYECEGRACYIQIRSPGCTVIVRRRVFQYEPDMPILLPRAIPRAPLRAARAEIARREEAHLPRLALAREKSRE